MTERFPEIQYGDPGKEVGWAAYRPTEAYRIYPASFPIVAKHWLFGAGQKDP